MIRAYISFGSNYKAEENLRKGIAILIEEFSLIKISPIYESEPTDDETAENYINGVIALDTEHSPQKLKEILTGIENQCGRDRTRSTEDKPVSIALDFDILLYGESSATYSFGDKTYHVPHGDILTQPHVAIPLAHLAPTMAHFETGTSLLTIAAGFTGTKLKRRDDIRLLS